MRDQFSATPLLVDPCVVLGRFAVLLSDGSALAAALDALVADLGLTSAVVRTRAGDVLGVGGEALHAVPYLRVEALLDPSVELPVVGRSGATTATMTLLGARPSQLPVLRTAAAVLGLALVTAPSGTDLLEAAEADRDELADSLHDGPVQSLVVARYAADAAVRGGDVPAVRDAVQQALTEARRLLWKLRPRGGSGLLSALEQLADQLTEAGAAPLGVLGSTDLDGPSGVLAYRLVQAVTGSAAVRVAVRLDGPRVVVEVVGGTPLTSPERWVHRAQALGGDLSASAGLLRLVLPLISDARTAP